jgi:hydroxypyruvate isomerase
MYTEFPVLERFEQAAASGFRAVEFLYPQDDDLAGMRAALDHTGLTLLQINAPRGRGNGERTGANDPRQREEYRSQMERAFEMAAYLGASQMHCTSGATLPDLAFDVQWETLVENMVWVAERAATFGITPMVEPLNTFDNPNYMVPTTTTGIRLIDAAGQPNLRLQYDLYHTQRMEGNHTDNLTRLLPRIANIQVSETPGRRALGNGELNLPYIFRLLDHLGYAGWVGVGYLTDSPTDDSLNWLRASGFWDR